MPLSLHLEYSSDSVYCIQEVSLRCSRLSKLRKLEGNFVQVRRNARRRSTSTVASDAQIQRMRSRTEDEKKLPTSEEEVTVDERISRTTLDAEHLKQRPRRAMERRLRGQMVASDGNSCERHEQLLHRWRSIWNQSVQTCQWGWKTNEDV